MRVYGMIVDKNIIFVEKDNSELQRDFKLDYILINKNKTIEAPVIHIRFYDENTDTKVQKDFTCGKFSLATELKLSLGDIVGALYDKFENASYAFEELDYQVESTIWQLFENNSK